MARTSKRARKGRGPSAPSSSFVYALHVAQVMRDDVLDGFAHREIDAIETLHARLDIYRLERVVSTKVFATLPNAKRFASDACVVSGNDPCDWTIAPKGRGPMTWSTIWFDHECIYITWITKNVVR